MLVITGWSCQRKDYQTHNALFIQKSTQRDMITEGLAKWLNGRVYGVEVRVWFKD
jgi:hypothetical protein